MDATTEIVQSFMQFELVPKQQPLADIYHKIPFSQFGAIGAGFATLSQKFKSVADGNGSYLYRAVSKNGDAIKLQFKAKDGTGYVGGLIENGSTAQARFQEIIENGVEINPMDVYMMVALVAINKKLDDVKAIQEHILGFLEIDKRTEMEGALAFLIDAVEKYKYNWNNETYRANMHLKTQDIKQQAEHSILFYRRRISEEMKKKDFVIFENAVNEKKQKLSKDFDNYQLAVYLSAFASFMEVMCLCNFDSNFLNNVSSTIENHSHQYMELYTDCYNLLEQTHQNSLPSLIAKGVAAASGGLGHIAEKIPIINDTKIDENLILSESRIMKESSNRIADSLHSFTASKSSMVRPFIEMTDSINQIHNNKADYLFDDKNLYIPLPI